MKVSGQVGRPVAFASLAPHPQNMVALDTHPSEENTPRFGTNLEASENKTSQPSALRRVARWGLAGLLALGAATGVYVSKHTIPDNEIGVVVSGKNNTPQNDALKPGPHLVLPYFKNLVRYDLKPNKTQDMLIFDTLNFNLVDLSVKNPGGQKAYIYQIDSDVEMTWKIDPDRIVELHQKLNDPQLNRNLGYYANIFSEIASKKASGLTRSFKAPFTAQIENANNRLIYEKIILPRLMERFRQGFSDVYSGIMRKHLQNGGHGNDPDRRKGVNLEEIGQLVENLYRHVDNPKFRRGVIKEEMAFPGTLKDELQRDFGIEITHIKTGMGGWGSTSLRSPE